MKKNKIIYVYLLKNIIIYFVTSIILISILNFIGRYFSINGLYKLSNIAEILNKIAVYILSLLEGIFISSRVSIRQIKTKFIWILLNCFVSFLIFLFIDIIMLISTFAIFPLPD